MPGAPLSDIRQKLSADPFAILAETGQQSDPTLVIGAAGLILC
jgi:hypothetical protein